MKYLYFFFLSFVMDALFLIPAFILWHHEKDRWWGWLLYVPLMVLSYFLVVYIKKEMEKKHERFNT
jgi:hypothetical protein